VINIQIVDNLKNTSSKLIKNKNVLIFGRSQDCDAVLNHRAISRKHFKISQKKSNDFTIEDLGSKNGLKIKSNEKIIQLHPGESKNFNSFESIECYPYSIKTKSLKPRRPIQHSIEILKINRKTKLEAHLFIDNNFSHHQEDELINPKTLSKMAVEFAIKKCARDLSNEEVFKLEDEVYSEAFGLGPLQGFLNNPKISDILINGKNNIYIEIGGKLSKSNEIIFTDAILKRYLNQLVRRCGKRLDTNRPYFNGRLESGVRIHAIIPPLSTKEPVISIRKPAISENLKLNLNHSSGLLPAPCIPILEEILKKRGNLLISGSTGSGKTTLINCLLNSIDPNERIITIEDNAELKINSQHWISLETREANIEGKGEISLRDLLINVLRMRPDRIIVGECRSHEVIEYLQALNTGHSGSMTSIHANSCRDSLARMELLIMLNQEGLNIAKLKTWIHQSLHYLIHVKRFEDGSRRICEISKLCGVEGEQYLLRKLYG